MKKKLVLINPHPKGRHGEEDIRVIVQMPLNLAYIAAHTPRERWDIDLIDEIHEPALDDDGHLTFDADLVGITSLTYQAPRAYRIAEKASSSCSADSSVASRTIGPNCSPYSSEKETATRSLAASNSIRSPPAASTIQIPSVAITL